MCEDLVRRGPAAGIIAVFATQRPDAKSLLIGISGKAVLRFCPKVMGHTANDQVLGTSAHKSGVRATIFSRRDLGIGWLAGEDDDPRIVRTSTSTTPATEAVVSRARGMREQAGTLSGHCLGGDEQLTPAASLLDDMAVIFAQAEVTKLSSKSVPARSGSTGPTSGASEARPSHALSARQIAA